MAIGMFIEYNSYKEIGGRMSPDEFYKVANRLPCSSETRLARVEIRDNALPIGLFNLAGYVVYAKLSIVFPHAEPSWKAEKTLEIISSNSA